MRSNSAENTVHRRFMSFISYAFSSIVFDIFAYTMSGKLVGLFNTQQNLLFYFPSLSYNLFSTYAPNADSVNLSLVNLNDFIVVLPIITFLGGMLLQKVVSRKAENYEGASGVLAQTTAE